MSFMEVIIAIDLFFVFPVFLFSIIMICISIWAVPPSLSRTYCLNVAIPSFLFSFWQLSIFVCFEAGLVQFLDSIYAVYVFLAARIFTLYGYLYFSTMTILLSFIGYVKPQMFQSVTKTRNITFMVWIGHAWTVVCVLTLFPRLFVGIFPILAEMDFSVMMTVQVVFVLLIYMTMVVIYILAIFHVLRRIGDNRGYFTTEHRRSLTSILIYCTAPNVLCAVGLSFHVCETVQEISVWHYFDPSTTDDIKRLCASLTYWAHGLTNIRIFINVFTALIAFHDYRVAVRKAILWIATSARKALKSIFRLLM